VDRRARGDACRTITLYSQTQVNLQIVLVAGPRHGRHAHKVATPLVTYCKGTVAHPRIGTGISEASKRVPIFHFATQGGKQARSYFRQRNWSKPERLRSGSLQADLSLIV
jgi:hypothetical protein